MRMVAFVAMMVAAGCGHELPAMCDMPSTDVWPSSTYADPCGECGGECVPMCALSCDVEGNVSASQAFIVMGEPYCAGGSEMFCGRWRE